MGVGRGLGRGESVGPGIGVGRGFGRGGFGGPAARTAELKTSMILMCTTTFFNKFFFMYVPRVMSLGCVETRQSKPDAREKAHYINRKTLI